MYEGTFLKQQILKVLTQGEKKDRLEATDDSILQVRTNFEEIQFNEQLTEDMNVQPLSQYVQNEYSQLVDSEMMTFDNGGAASETESEDDTSETEKECIRQISQVKLSSSTFRNYLLWTTKNTVKRELVKTGFVETVKEEQFVKKELVLEDLISTVKSSFKQESPKAVSPVLSSDSSGEMYNTNDLLGKKK